MATFTEASFITEVEAMIAANPTYSGILLTPFVSNGDFAILTVKTDEIGSQNKQVVGNKSLYVPKLDVGITFTTISIETNGGSVDAFLQISIMKPYI